MKSKLTAVFLLLCGAALLTAALALYSGNRREDEKAGEAAAENLSQLLLQIEPKEPPEAQQEDQPEETRPLTPEECVMTEVELNGNTYIGYLSVPALELELPVISQWNYDALQIAPCRYSGTMKGKDLIILAHNFDQHFGKLDELELGAEAAFTDMDALIYRYQLVHRETLDGGDVEGMTSGNFDLTLFTCTYDSQSRMVFRFQRTPQ